MGGDFNHGYANKSGQKRKGKARQSAKRTDEMARKMKSGFQGAEGKSVEEGRALRETMERSAKVVRKIVLLSRLAPIHQPRLNKADPHFFSLFSEKLPGHPRLLFSLSL